MSTFERMHPTHMFAGFGSIGVPHSQHAIKPCVGSLCTSVSIAGLTITAGCRPQLRHSERLRNRTRLIPKLAACQMRFHGVRTVGASLNVLWKANTLGFGEQNKWRRQVYLTELEIYGKCIVGKAD